MTSQTLFTTNVVNVAYLPDSCIGNHRKSGFFFLFYLSNGVLVCTREIVYLILAEWLGLVNSNGFRPLFYSIILLVTCKQGLRVRSLKVSFQNDQWGNLSRRTSKNARNPQFTEIGTINRYFDPVPRSRVMSGYGRTRVQTYNFFRHKKIGKNRKKLRNRNYTFSMTLHSTGDNYIE